MHNKELKDLVGTKGFIRVEVKRWNPSGQVEIKPLCSNCDGLEVWVKPKDIINHMIAELDLKQLISAEALKERFKDIAKSPTNGGLFHIAEILRIIDMEKNNEKNNVQ